MVSSLCILLSIIQDGETVKRSEVFEIKAEQNHIFRGLFDLFLKLQVTDTAVGNTLGFFILYENKNLVGLNDDI